MATKVTFRFDESGMRHTFQSWDGPVGRSMFQRGTKVQLAAKRQVGKDTHRLERSIVKRMDRGPAGRGAAKAGDLVMRVGSFGSWWSAARSVNASAGTTDYSVMHHEGTRPHAIVPRNPAGVLRFVKDGRVIFAKRVWHPGTRPNRYLSDNLHLAVD